MYDIYDNDFDKAFDEAVEEVQKGYDRGFAEGYAKGKAEAEPTKHGRWIRTDAFPHKVYCSECYVTLVPNENWLDDYNLKSNYCPNCGARMDAQIGEDKSHPFAESVMMGMDEVDNG